MCLIRNLGRNFLYKERYSTVVSTGHTFGFCGRLCLPGLQTVHLNKVSPFSLQCLMDLFATLWPLFLFIKSFQATNTNRLRTRSPEWIIRADFPLRAHQDWRTLHTSQSTQVLCAIPYAAFWLPPTSLGPVQLHPRAPEKWSFVKRKIL